MRVCTGCKLSKPLEEYHRDSRKPDGKRIYCKVCTSEQNQRRYETHGSRDYLARVPGAKRRRLLSLYGLTQEDYDALLAKQNHVCAICLQPETTKNKNLAVDHNHTTGKVRGLLCFNCNVGLGKLETHMDRAKEYLDGEN